ncbi:MAG: proton-conducting transporter membrane subunit [Chloroflexota bacterium]|nr:proton-conducting transporter membrane subunit [Chloroflexota bacterium]
MIAGSLLLLIIPLVMAGIVYTLLRWASLSALLAVGTALALGIAVVTLPLDQPVHFWGERQVAMGEAVTFLGRELVLEQADRMAMAFLFLTAAGIFFLAWRVTPHSLLFPMGLGLLSLLSGALLIRPLIYAALLVEIAAALSIFALQAEGQPATRGGLRYLTFTTLALPGVLVTNWLVERYVLTPDEVGLLNAAAALLAVSFALLLGVVPFHTWVPAITGDSVPLAGTFVLTVGNGAVWFLLLDFLETYPWLNTHPYFGSLFSAAGLAMIIVGGLLAPSQRRLGSMMGYSALVDSGGALVALGMHSQLGLTLVLLSLLVRPFGLALMATGLSGLRARSGDDDSFDALRGAGWKAPWSMAVMIFGGLSAAGLPVSAGFTWRWSLYRALMLSSPGSAVILLLASVGVMAGIWRGLSALLVRPRPPEGDRLPRVTSEGWLTAAVAVVAILACVGVGLFPQVLAPLAARMAETFTFLAP